jgi:predicted Rdx family selenoprotein
VWNSAQRATPSRHAALEPGTGTLADLVADARAIPAGAFALPKQTAKRVVELVEPARDVVVRIPDAAVDLMRDAEQAFADYLPRPT